MSSKYDIIHTVKRAKKNLNHVTDKVIRKGCLSSKNKIYLTSSKETKYAPLAQ